jgi:CRP/FNR family transcriptional regulator
MNTLFFNAVTKLTDISLEETALLYASFQVRRYKKNSILIREGEVAHELFFILQGAVRQYFAKDDGIEKTCCFTFESEFFTDMESFSRKSYSLTNFITLEPTECLVISCKDLMKVLNVSTAIAELCRSIIEKVATDNIRRVQSMLSLSPEKQFIELVQSNPDLLQRVPQRYIAQYLGLAPESLSRMRKRMLITEKA